MRILASVVAVLVLAGCGSSGPGAPSKPVIAWGTKGSVIAKQLGVCGSPVSTGGLGARCDFLNGDKVLVNGIAGAADQQIAVPTSKQTDFCDLIGHGFDLVALSYGQLAAHVHLNAIVSKYGGTIAGGTC